MGNLILKFKILKQKFVQVFNNILVHYFFVDLLCHLKKENCVQQFFFPNFYLKLEKRYEELMRNVKINYQVLISKKKCYQHNITKKKP